MAMIDILKLAGKNHKRFDGEFGIEIETESKKTYDVPPMKFWVNHADGSLRDFGVEYVLKQPVKYLAEVNQALEEFKDKTKDIKFIKDSITTSVHVHVNMLPESVKTLGNFLTTYTLLENLLIRYSGPDRLSNLFCLPICDAEDTYKNIMSIFQNINSKKYIGLNFSENAVKYAACNVATLYKYGSIEIRSFRGETDTDKIRNWISILYRILDYSRDEKLNPKEIILSWKDKQNQLLDNIFKDYRKEIHHPDELKLIEQNAWYAASIAFCVKDWELIDKTQEIPPFKLKQADLDKTAKALFGRPFDELVAADQFHVTHLVEKNYYSTYGVSKAKPIDVGVVNWDNIRARDLENLHRAQARAGQLPQNPPDPWAVQFDEAADIRRAAAQLINNVNVPEVERDRDI